jgi:bacillithiol system protein YtxJ
MNWITLNDIQQVDTIIAASKTQPVVIFKHSTRCSISSMAKSRLERSEVPSGVQFYYLDLIAHRDVSNFLAEHFHVHHESPQVLLIKDGECVYDESHNGINMDEIEKQAIALN